MPEFTYKAQNAAGSMLKGTMEAANEAFVLQSLRGKGYYPIEIKKAVPSRELKMDLFLKVGLKDIAVFCRQFATVISAGITITGGLDIMRQQTENRKLKEILDKIFEEVQKGKSLSESMRQFKEFPVLFINMVEAGEASGRLEEVLERMAVYYEKESKLKQKIKSAMMYPILISTAAVGVVVFLVTSILPMFVEMFKGFNVELPLPTRMVLGLSSAMTNYWYIIIPAIIIIVYVLKRYGKTDEGKYKFDRLALKLPIFGKINKKIITSRFARTLSILMGSGIPVIQSMEIVEKTIMNAVVEEGIKKCKEDIRKGSGLTNPIAAIGIFPPMLIEMINIGEETGTLDTMLSKTAQFYDEEVDVVIAGLTTLIEPVILVVLGVVIGFIIISIMLPMFDMYQYM